MELKKNWQLNETGSQIYERYFVPSLFDPWASEIIELAQPKRDEATLDVACGTGLVSRKLCEKINSLKYVVGLDKNAEMLKVASTIVTVNSLPIDLVQGDVQFLPFSSGSFDIVFCQLGLQFFLDKIEALSEMKRVLVPNGRIALLVWSSIQNSPGYYTLAKTLGALISEQAAKVMQTPFEMKDKNELYTLMNKVGFQKTDIFTKSKTVRFSSIDDFIHFSVSGPPLSVFFNKVDNEIKTRFFDEVKTALRMYVIEDKLAFPIEAHLVLAYN